MTKHLINLQMFGEGGDGSGAGSVSASAEGSTAGEQTGNTGVVYQSKRKGKENPLKNVVYGNSDGSATDNVNANRGITTNANEDTAITFESMIKKGGLYHDEFTKRTQEIINQRFKETKGLQESLEKQSPILSMLFDKYGVESGNLEALEKALDEDSSFYEQAAFDAGLTVEQYKHMKDLERQNAEFSKAKEAQERKENSQRIYEGWVRDADEFAKKYGIQNFSLENEVQNPEFTKLLANGVSVEGAYKAIHFDDMVGGAMASTAINVKQQLVNSIADRRSRPTENGTNPQSSKIFKQDVSKLSRADRAEIARRASRGETISFG